MKKSTTNRKKNILRIVLFVGTVISLYFVPWILVRAWIMPLPDSVQEQLDDAVDLGFDGIIAYVDKGGQSPEFYAAGWHDRDKKIPARPKALFKIASIGKLYDAVAVTKLVGNGQLSLDKTLAEYFPDLVDRIENADQITLRMMVQHRSGIPNYTDTPNFWVDPPESQQEALELILDMPADFGPDEDYAYSNTNYLLLTMLIEKTTGMSKFAFISDMILQPLGLKNTYGSLKEVNLDELMSGYYAGVEEDIKTADYGSIIASAEDVGIFLRALNEGTLFTEGEKEIYASIYVFDHDGLIPGYQSIAKYHEDSDMVVIQFVNSTDFEGYTWNLSEIVHSRIIKISK